MVCKYKYDYLLSQRSCAHVIVLALLLTIATAATGYTCSLQGCFTTVAAAVEPLDKLREEDGKLARFLQPYWAPGPLLSPRAGHQIGPFVGYQVVSHSRFV